MREVNMESMTKPHFLLTPSESADSCWIRFSEEQLSRDLYAPNGLLAGLLLSPRHHQDPGIEI